MSQKRSKVKTQNYIQNIPKDLIKEILKHVHYRDIVRLGLTDKSMNSLTRVEFSNLLSGSHPALHKPVSRMRAPHWSGVGSTLTSVQLALLLGASGEELKESGRPARVRTADYQSRTISQGSFPMYISAGHPKQSQNNGQIILLRCGWHAAVPQCHSVAVPGFASGCLLDLFLDRTVLSSIPTHTAKTYSWDPILRISKRSMMGLLDNNRLEYIPCLIAAPPVQNLLVDKC